jgi:hypothetical protein
LEIPSVPYVYLVVPGRLPLAPGKHARKNSEQLGPCARTDGAHVPLRRSPKLLSHLIQADAGLRRLVLDLNQERAAVVYRLDVEAAILGPANREESIGRVRYPYARRPLQDLAHELLELP